MQYKIIVLQLLEQHPELYERFRQQRTMLPTLEYYARELKILHEAWMEVILRVKPGSRIGSIALELALDDLQTRLPGSYSVDNIQTLSLDSMMTYIHRHSPHA